MPADRMSNQALLQASLNRSAISREIERAGVEPSAVVSDFQAGGNQARSYWQLRRDVRTCRGRLGSATEANGIKCGRPLTLPSNVGLIFCVGTAGVCALASAGSCAEQRTRQRLGRTGALKLGGQLGIAGSRPDQPNWPPEGLEPPTCCLEGSCSIQLSYGQSVA